MSEWLYQLWEILTMEYYLAIKKEQNVDLCNNLNESQKIIQLFFLKQSKG